MTWSRSLVRRTRQISWAPSGWLETDITKDTSTDFVTLTCSDDFVAIRVGLTNINREPYSATKIIASASSTVGDYVNPTGNSRWTSLTFAHKGEDVGAIVTSGDAPTVITAWGNETDAATGDSSIPQWTWTDWTPLLSVPRTDVPDAPRVVMIRVLLPQACALTRPNGSFREYHLNSGNRGFEYVAGHAPVDAVTVPRSVNGTGARIGQSKSPISCIQFLTRNEGIVGMVTGDSHHQGTSTTTQFWNYLLRSIVDIGARHVGRIPCGYWSTAKGGSTSDWFFTSLVNVLPIAKPGFVVLPGWTYNEMPATGKIGQTANELFFARLLMAAEACANYHAVPIFLTPFPRDAAGMTAVRLTQWRTLRKSILSLRETGATVLDATSLLGHKSEGQFDGTYLSQYTDDQKHPNDAGHAFLAERLTPIIETACGLGGT